MSLPVYTMYDCIQAYTVVVTIYRKNKEQMQTFNLKLYSFQIMSNFLYILIHNEGKGTINDSALHEVSFIQLHVVNCGIVCCGIVCFTVAVRTFYAMRSTHTLSVSCV